MSHHPADEGHDVEVPSDVFNALLDEMPSNTIRTQWEERWQRAQEVERRRRDYDRKWDESLMGVHRFGQ